MNQGSRCLCVSVVSTYVGLRLQNTPKEKLNSSFKVGKCRALHLRHEALASAGPRATALVLCPGISLAPFLAHPVLISSDCVF